MSQYDNNLRGALFKNLKQREGKQDPDYQGQCEIEGKPYWISSWINTNKKDGKKYMSLVFRPKEEQAPPPAPAQAAIPLDDDIPF